MPRRAPKRKARKKGFARGGARADHYAHHVVETALRNGTLVRSDRCEACGQVPSPLKNGKNAVQAHHDDYNFPLRVRWLCKGCHFRWHRHHVAIPRRGDPPPIERAARPKKATGKGRTRQPERRAIVPNGDLLDRMQQALLDDAVFLASA